MVHFNNKSPSRWTIQDLEAILKCPTRAAFDAIKQHIDHATSIDIDPDTGGQWWTDLKANHNLPLDDSAQFTFYEVLLVEEAVKLIWGQKEKARQRSATPARSSSVSQYGSASQHPPRRDTSNQEEPVGDLRKTHIHVERRSTDRERNVLQASADDSDEEGDCYSSLQQPVDITFKVICGEKGMRKDAVLGVENAQFDALLEQVKEQLFPVPCAFEFYCTLPSGGELYCENNDKFMTS